MTVRIAAVQYLLRQIHDWSGFENQLRFVGKAAGDYKPQFVLLPEIFTTQLLSFMDTRDLKTAVRAMDGYTHRYIELCKEIAAEWGFYFVAGSHPTMREGKLYNTAYLITPGGEVYEQDKIHRTRWEREKWSSDPGDQLKLFDTPHGKIAILICYDIEFPELSRMVCEEGADILFVPSCTDDRQGYLRVRYCCAGARDREPGLRRDDRHRGQPPGRGTRRALRPGEHHDAVGFPVRARRDRRRRHAEPRADRDRRRPPAFARRQPRQRNDDPVVRQAQGCLRKPGRTGEGGRLARAKGVAVPAMRADRLLVARGLASSRTLAQRLIDAGRVRAGESLVRKASETLDEHTPLSVAPGEEDRYVSRGGLKLAAALLAGAIDPRGLDCLDVGQSTGGFTDCLLRSGARRVVGIDVGHGQLHARLRDDPRVRTFEGVNARSIDAGTLGEAMPPEGFALIVVDVSFISLALVLPALAALAACDAGLVALVKPQFEVGRDGLDKRGIVRDRGAGVRVRERIAGAAREAGWTVRRWIDSPITGGDGNREFLLVARRAHEPSDEQADRMH